MSKLEGKIAVITGGTTGIGLATAKLFQKEGAKVAITGRSDDTLAEARQVLGPEALVVKSDTSKLADIDQLFAEVKQKWGRVDVLFVNAGIAKFSPIEEVTEEFFDTHFNINVKGAYFTIQKALPLIPNGGAIILNASAIIHKGFPQASVYTGTKAALRSFGQALAPHLAPRSIRINTISPGPIATPIQGKLGFPPEQLEELNKGFAELPALKRIGAAEEVATAALFFASSDSSYITGVELPVDGGITDI